MSVIGFVSTYQPTLCGLATFSASLYAELVTSSASQGRVVRVVDSPQPRPSNDVVAELVAGDPMSATRAATALAGCDVVILQHEFGIYGGPDGDEVPDVVRSVHRLMTWADRMRHLRVRVNADTPADAHRGRNDLELITSIRRRAAEISGRYSGRW